MIGKIYRIVHLQSEMCYIGSTFNLLKHRWNGHKSQFKHWDEGKTTKGCSIYPYFKEHGIDQFKMVLIKEYEVADRAQLLAYEQLWMNRFRRTCVNQKQTFWLLMQQSRKETMKKYETESRVRPENYKEKMKQKFNCDCGGKFTHQSRARYLKLAKHLNRANAL
ncbi:GIY-YIG domain [Phytophthora cactorum]|nr:GIY-YIG domain [Phytophthora cactorum]